MTHAVDEVQCKFSLKSREGEIPLYEPVNVMLAPVSVGWSVTE